MRIGHLPTRGVAIPPFYAGQIGAQAAQRARHGLEVIPMHFGQPSEGASPAALSAAHAHLEGYLDGPAGYWESAALRERIALHYREQHDVNVAPERILLTTGASAGLVATFTALFAAGDRVALARPGYPAYRNALRALGRVPGEVDCGPEHGFRLAPELLPSSASRCTGFSSRAPRTRREPSSARPSSRRSPPNAAGAARVSSRTRSTTASNTAATASRRCSSSRKRS
jgi:Aspartate/tyrosine/aromatic aminotransferase